MARTRLLLSVLLSCLWLASSASARADDPVPRTKAGKAAQEQLAAHERAIEEDARAEAEAARTRLARLVTAGKDLAEVRWRYARALWQAAEWLRGEGLHDDAARETKRLEALARGAPDDDRTVAAWIRELWFLGRDQWNDDDATAARATFERIRALASRPGAGAHTLDRWVWILDGIHHVHADAGDAPRARALLDEMRAVVDTHGATDMRSEELLRSLLRAFEARAAAGETEAAEALFAEVHRRGDRGKDTPPWWHVGVILRRAQDIARGAGDTARADEHLAALRALVARTKTDDDHLQLMIALAGAVTQGEAPMPLDRVDALVVEGRSLMGRDEVPDAEQAEFVRLLRNAAIRAARGRDMDRVTAWAMQARALAEAASVEHDLVTQYGLLLRDVVEVFRQQEARVEARSLLPAVRAHAGREGRTPAMLEHHADVMLDLHILAERSPAATAAERQAMLAELKACFDAPDASPRVRLTYAYGLYNRNLYCWRRGEGAQAREPLVTLRALVAAHPSEAPLRSELLDILLREFERGEGGDADRLERLAEEAHAIAALDDAPATHRARYLALRVGAMSRAYERGEHAAVRSLYAPVAAWLKRPVLSEEERRWQVAALRYMTHAAGALGDRARVALLVTLARKVVERPEATPLQRSEFVRLLEVDVHHLVDAGDLDAAWPRLEDIAALAARPDARGYDGTRYAWCLSWLHQEALDREEREHAERALHTLRAFHAAHPDHPDATGALVSTIGDLEAVAAEAGALARASALRDEARALVDAFGAPGRPHTDLAVLLDRYVYRLTDARPPDFDAIAAAVGEMQRRFDRAEAAPAERQELSDTLQWAQQAYVREGRVADAGRMLTGLRELAARADATARMRVNLMWGLIEAITLADREKTYESIPLLEAEARVVAARHPRETKVQDIYARILSDAHEHLGATDDFVPPALAMLDRLRAFVRQRDGVTGEQRGLLSRALSHAVAYAQYDDDFDAALVVLEELREHNRRTGDTADQRRSLAYAIRRLMERAPTKGDARRAFALLDEVEALVAREDATPPTRSLLGEAYEELADRFEYRFDDAPWDELLKRARPQLVVADDNERPEASYVTVLALRARNLRLREDPRAPEAWSDLGAWVRREGAVPRERRTYAQILGQEVAGATKAQDAERLARFLRDFETLVAADPADKQVIAAFHAGREG